MVSGKTQWGGPDDSISSSMVVLVLIAGLVIGSAAGYLVSDWMAVAPLSSAKVQLADAQAQIGILRDQLDTADAKVAALNVQTVSLGNQSRQNYLEIFSPADLYQSKFHDLMQEHDILLADALRRSSTSQPSYNASYFALKDNVHRIADQIALVYGNKASGQFIVLWDRKIDNFLKYGRAVQSGDAVKANLAFDADMADYEEQSASFWSSINPFIKKDVVKQAVNDHIELVKKAQDYWVINSYSDYFITLHQSYDQMGQYADVIVEGIIQQHPELFLKKK